MPFPAIALRLLPRLVLVLNGIGGAMAAARMHLAGNAGQSLGGRADGHEIDDTRVVAGVRFWF